MQMKTNERIYVRSYDSPCGCLKLGSYGDSLCLCNWLHEKHPGRVDRRLQRLLEAEYAEKCTAVTDEAARQLDAYFLGQRTWFDVPLLFAGTEFQLRVWRCLAAIPYGQTVSYVELARAVGCPQSVRAVANANGANAISVFAPCHRVIGSGGALAGYGGGVEAKRFLLELERSVAASGV